MKSPLALICSAAIILCLTGCGTSSLPAESSSSAPAVSSVPAKQVGEWESGNWEENRYINEWADIAFTLPYGWRPLTAEEILHTLGAGADILSEKLSADREELSASISETDLYAFYTMKENGEAFFFLDIFSREAGGVPDMTAEEYLTQLIGLYESLPDYRVTAGEIEYGAFCGKNSAEIAIMLENAENPNVPSSIQSYTVAEHGPYLLVYCGTVNTADKAVLDELSRLTESCRTVEDFLRTPPEEAVKTAHGEWDAGQWSGSVYTNEWADITFTLPKNWKRDRSAENVIENGRLTALHLSDTIGSSIVLMLVDKKAADTGSMDTEAYLDLVMSETLRSYPDYTAALSEIETVCFDGKDTAMSVLNIALNKAVKVGLTWSVQDWDPYFLVTVSSVPNPEIYTREAESADRLFSSIVKGE